MGLWADDWVEREVVVEVDAERLLQVEGVRRWMVRLRMDILSVVVGVVVGYGGYVVQFALWRFAREALDRG